MPNDVSRFLSGNFGPVRTELEVTDLPVDGELPRSLNGTLFRNGPNPQFPPPDPSKHHWFLGDGMVHAFTLDGGRASYRNRWVRTGKFVAEQAAGHALDADAPPETDGAFRDTGAANTNIVWHGGRLLALEEAHLPIELDPATLATRGVRDFGGAVPAPFTAHPKTDPVTGELVFFGYSASGPLSRGMTYGTIAADGRVTRVERFDAPYCSMVHDFAVSAGHVVFPVMPLHGSIDLAMRGLFPFVWDPSLGGAIGVIRRNAGVASLRWFRAETCFVFHVLNAWDNADGSIHVDVMQYDAPPLFPRADGRVSSPAETTARLVRWTIDPEAATDAFRQSRLDDMPGEFPRIDERVAGHANRFGAFAGVGAAGGDTDIIAWIDLATGRRSGHRLPPGDATSEPVLVPRSESAAEGDGWLLAVVWRGSEARSELIVLDTQDIAHGPVATVRLPQRVPFGFHGNWMPAG
ncbi:MAG TPA: carotenoid oxygenase family protein [Acetobacteraceae bacterium]|nr:carotenoid oxygenase family protein [Acetobacteraceae bacterium]